MDNWIQTLRAFKYLWSDKLKKINNFKFLLSRNINQDPIECLFGSIRCHGVRNINPTSFQFIASFKTLLVNNFSSTNLVGNNCESDDCTVLDNLKSFLNGSSIPNSPSNDTVIIPLSLDLPTKMPKTLTSGLTVGYVSGYIIRRILIICNNCLICKGDITENTITNDLIKARCYSKHSLKNPTKNFERIVENIYSVLSQCMPQFCNETNLSQKLNFAIELNVEFNFNCKIHCLKDIVINKMIMFFIFSYTKKINQVLKGVNYYKTNDVIVNMANSYYKVHKSRKTKIKLLKQL